MNGPELVTLFGDSDNIRFVNDDVFAGAEEGSYRRPANLGAVPSANPFKNPIFLAAIALGVFIIVKRMKKRH